MSFRPQKINSLVQLLLRSSRQCSQHQTHLPHLSLNRFDYTNMATLENLNFDNLALRQLPIDSVEQNYVRTVSGACFSLVQPTPVENPKTVAYSVPAMSLLDLPEEELKRADFPEYLSGNKLFPGAKTAAHCYCGHQFGYFSGQLGDGATMYVGEVVNKKGERWEIQFKGAGSTPYSRSADGRKVLRSSIREFLCSEAMHHLGIPTTRAGSCVTSDTKVIRDIFYDGNPIQERATIILRIAETFIRFGSFEIFKPIDETTGRRGPSVGQTHILETLTNYVIETFYPQIWEAQNNDKEEMYVEFFKEVLLRTARLVALWQCVGWCHGVLNTDNMSILGLTIDYGPYGFIDTFDPGFICNASDDGGRYSYDKQPEICKWNCGKLAEALAPIVSLDKLKSVLSAYDEEYQKTYQQQLMKKFGLTKEQPEDKKLFSSFFETMHQSGADFTNTFRSLSRLPLPGSPEFESCRSEVREYIVSQCCTLEELKLTNKPRMEARQFQTLLMVLQMQPDMLERLGRGAALLYQEIQRREKLQELQDMTPEGKKTADKKLWDDWLEKYCRRLELEVTDPHDLSAINLARTSMMNNANPKFILRNYIAQNAIDAAENGDFSEVRLVLKLLQHPYEETVNFTENRSSQAQGESQDEASRHTDHYIQQYCKHPPVTAHSIQVT